MSALKESIKAHVMMQHPQTWLESCERIKGVEIVINAKIEKPLITTFPNPSVVTTPNYSNSQPIYIQNPSLEEMTKHQCIHLCYNCDE